jgi:tol-pal system protein YbgF
MGTHRPTLAWLAACGVLSASLTGCLAQKAELAQVERDLGTKISSLDRQKKELEQSIKQANADIDRLVRETRAKFLQQVTSLREEELASVRGDLEKKGDQLARLEGRADDLNARLREMDDRAAKRLAAIEKSQEDQAAAMKADRERLSLDLGKLGARLEKLGETLGTFAKALEQHDKALASAEARDSMLAQQLDAQGRGLAEQMGQFRTALGDFKAALNGFGEKLVQEHQRLVELDATVSRQNDALAKKLAEDEKTTSAYFAELNKSVTSVAKALQTVSKNLVSRLDEQQHKLSQLETQVATRPEKAETHAARRGQPSHKQHATTSGAGEPAPVAPLSTGPEPTRSDAGSGPAPLAEAPEPNRQSMKEEYDRGVRKLQQGDFDGAMQEFSEFLARHPQGELAPNAQYWLGECYYGKKDYERAIEAYDGVARYYPASEKVPAALLKKGFAYLALKDRMRASTVLKQVIEAYPKTPEAHKAVAKLAELNKGR